MHDLTPLLPNVILCYMKSVTLKTTKLGTRSSNYAVTSIKVSSKHDIKLMTVILINLDIYIQAGTAYFGLMR
jgi:hypothetical protein